MNDDPHAAPRGTLREVASVFLKLGATAFGGPAAHIALMDEEFVKRRRWMGREEFIDLVGATNLIPGPNSTEVAMHIGHRRAGGAGLVVAGVGFILPAALIVMLLAWIYMRFGALPEADGILRGVKPVVIAVVAQALWGFLRTAVRTVAQAAIAVAGAAAVLLGVHELLVLAAGGAAAVALASGRGRGAAGPVARVSAGIGALLPIAVAATPFTLPALFLFFLKVGSVLFGSGYVLLAFLRADLVERWGWLTEGQLLDAVAIGQLTPGPVFTAATFIGYLLGGAPGAIVATVGIFLPAFVFVALSGPLIPRIRRSRTAGAFLDGVNATALALMGVVLFQLTRSALVDLITVGLAALSLVLLIRFRVPSVWLLAGGAAVGFLSTIRP
jgi:chromate transporter